MNQRDKKYIEEIFKYCKTNSILVINSEGHLERVRCPFMVLVIQDVFPLIQGDKKVVNAVKIGPKLVDLYIIEEKAFYHFNFILI
jgi:hypothetical protein